MQLKLVNSFKDLGKGFIAGFLFAAIICGFAAFLINRRYKERELVRYEKMQSEIQELREDYINRDPDEFFEIPGVRRAADGAADEFNRKLAEILQRFRNRLAD
jgi:hypothetical protein